MQSLSIPRLPFLMLCKTWAKNEPYTMVDLVVSWGAADTLANVAEIKVCGGFTIKFK